MTPSVQRLNLRRPDGTLTDLGNVLLGAVFGALLAAMACGVLYAVAAQVDAPGETDTEWVQLPDGRSVLCVVDGTGFDCDWSGAAMEGEVAP